MAITRLNRNNSIDNKIDLLNKMIIELNGLIARARFDKNELDDLYSQLSESGFNLDRKFLRDIVVGGTVDTSFSDWDSWEEVHTEAGYSIWKIAPENYAYNAVNNLYFNGQVLENRGEANSEVATSFQSVVLYDTDDSATYVDNTIEAFSESGTGFSVMGLVADYLYVGLDAPFNGMKFEWETRGSNYTPEYSYWNGSAWVVLTADDNNLVDDTNSFQSDGRVSWDAIPDWQTVAVNTLTRYWIRICTTTVPTTVASAYSLIPDDSVIGLLALSSTEILNEEWAWCSYNDYVYVTIRNSGNSTFEGEYYITGSSNATKKENFFVHNNQFTADYQDSTYA